MGSQVHRSKRIDIVMKTKIFKIELFGETLCFAKKKEETQGFISRHVACQLKPGEKISSSRSGHTI
jgi:hypothetical protein